MIILAALAVAALVVMIWVIIRGSKEKARLTKEFEDAEDDLQERITSLTGEKASLESRLAAMEEYGKRLEEEREKADKAMSEARENAAKAQQEAQEKALRLQAERHEKDLQSMKDAFKALSAENSAAFKVQSSERAPRKAPP